jgi:ribosomal-protein-alanine N-acetyltransferase
MRTDQITIRSLGYSDLPQVMSIERRAFPTPWSLAMFVLELSKSSSICLAADHADPAIRAVCPAPRPGEGSARGSLTGYLVCSRYADAWHLMNIAVDPPFRRRGIGAALLARLLERAGADAAYTLEVRPSNRAAIELYERFGFRSAGTRPRYYQDTGEDAVIMWRTVDALLDPAHPAHP